MSAEGISTGEVDRRVRLVTKLTAKEDLLGEPVVPPFDASNPPPAVELYREVFSVFDCLL